ncbi:hypothetical protein QYE76_047341 [Lolium multiflorum]|uniref:Aminotransferase-like plant mobile domain-containing protein n=1 Tax=Lolium multiflorum TaxID=4521 RepID=A0AAD8X1V4_LOLMU|nr:hypothetical protein QYE76_047341 [Lolium multiflorum]
MNAAALTALVERWRPETHTFHLRVGEMTPTLQDVSMILALPIQGEPLCMNTTSDGWRQQMENLIGMAPLEPEDKKDRAPTGAPFLWTKTHFVGRRLSQDWELRYWWMLAPSFRMELGPPTVGRPRILNQRPWAHYRNNLDREPTWAYIWDNISEMTNDPIVMYMHYTEELDTLTNEQVDWEPYGTFYRIGAAMTDLNPKCTEESNYWRCREGEIATSSSEDSEIPDDTILSQGKKQATRSAYQLKPRGKAPNRYTPEGYTNRGKKAVIESDEETPRRSALRRMRNDEPSSSEEEVEDGAPPPPPRRKQPARRGHRS